MAITMTLEAGHGRAAQALAEHDRRAPHRRDEHLAQEAELAVPDDRGGREDRGEHHRHREHARIDERAQVDPVRAGGGEPREAGAEHEQEQQRLQQRGDDPHPVAREADELALPDDLHRAQVAAQAASGDAHPRDRRVLVLGGQLAAGHRDIMRANCRPTSVCEASASRIVVPV
jgi:hypothetical protein